VVVSQLFLGHCHLFLDESETALNVYSALSKTAGDPVLRFRAKLGVMRALGELDRVEEVAAVGAEIRSEMSQMQLPIEVREDAKELLEWLDQAVSAAGDTRNG